jgi:hypothetical protein
MNLTLDKRTKKKLWRKSELLEDVSRTWKEAMGAA